MLCYAMLCYVILYYILYYIYKYRLPERSDYLLYFATQMPATEQPRELFISG